METKDALLVETKQGTVRGKRDGEVYAWLHLPYAAPPVGPRRFQGPQPPASWAGVRDATQAGASAIQPPMFPEPLHTVFNGRDRYSEDSLFVNVWSPGADGRKRPVCVWIHGGAFETGNGAMYSGRELAAMGDLVFVSINYRLNAFGFMNLAGLFEDERFEHNPGMLDQVAALRWVRDNIEAFGGDPGRVTIAGESAGSASVLTLMVMDAARGLFHGAIAQSAGLTLHHEWKDSLDLAQDFANRLGVSRYNRERMWSLPTAHISQAMEETKRARPQRLATRPYFDGRVLPRSYAEALAKRTPDIPLLIGTNRDEHRFFSVLKATNIPLTRASLANALLRGLGPEASEAILAHYPDTERGLSDLGTELVFTLPSLHFCEQHLAHAPTWRYRLDFPSPFLGFGAMHALDLLLLFPMPAPMRRLVLGRSTPELEALARRMKEHWVHFVREGRPGDDWPAYELEKRQTHIFDLRDQLLSDPDGERRRAWAGRDVIIP